MRQERRPSKLARVLRRFFIFTLVAAFTTACGGAPRGAHGGTVAPYPTALTDPAELAGDFLFEQEIVLEFHGADGSVHERGFRAVLQKRGPELLLLGLAPHGGRGFTLTQRGQDIEFTAHVELELPFPARYILHDIHRVWFQVATTSPSPDGEVRLERHGERVVESWSGGRLVERRFERLDGEPEGEIVVTYEGGLAPGAPLSAEPPSHVRLDNAWFGYTLRARTLSWRAIAAP